MPKKPFTPKVITANALLEGDVVYLTGDGWTRELREAEGAPDWVYYYGVLGRPCGEPFDDDLPF